MKLSEEKKVEKKEIGEICENFVKFVFWNSNIWKKIIEFE